MTQRLNWQPVEPFGAEVTIDLSQPLGGLADELRALLWDRQVLIFRGQSLDHGRQIAVVENFAPVLHSFEGAHYISTEKDQGVLGRAELPFHSDLSFVAHPRLVLSLHATDVPAGRTSTRWASARRALAGVPPALRRRLEGLRALQVYPEAPYTDRTVEHPFPDWLPRHSHPAILSHPVTREDMLYVMEMQTVRFEGLGLDESRALIEEVLSHFYVPSNILEHRWTNGDLVIWDNIATQHARGAIAPDAPRTLQKVQSGLESFAEQWPPFASRELQASLTAMS